MNARNLALILVFLATIARNHAYFEYALDCRPSCITSNKSCSITELSPSSFPIDCLDSNADCEALAKPDTACLRKGEEVLGGEKVWPDYSVWAGRNNTPTTTAAPGPNPGPTPQPGPGPTPPSPAPSPQPTPASREELFFKIYSLALTVGIALIGVGFAVRALYRRRGDSTQFEPLINPAAGGEISPESPYGQPTTQDR